MKKLALWLCVATFPFCCAAQDDLSRNDKKKLEQKFKVDKRYAESKRKQYESSKEIVAYVGENIRSLVNDWGPPTRTIDNGNGAQLYLYEKELQTSGGSYTPGSVSVTSDDYSVTVHRTEGTDTRYNHSYTSTKEVYVVNNVITHIERYLNAFPEHRRPDAKTIVQKDLKFAGKTKEVLRTRVLTLIRKNNYQLLSEKRYTKKPDEIVYRKFERMCTDRECGSTLYAITYVILEIDAAAIKAQVDQAMYSSLMGAELIMNDLGQVASVNDAPFSAYSAVSVKGYEIAHPERIYDHNGKMVNRFIYDRITGYFNGFIDEIADAVSK